MKGILAMIQPGKKSQIVGAEHWPRFQIDERPSKIIPILEQGNIVCGLDQGEGEIIFICETLEDMQMLYDEFISGNAIHISWYQTDAFKIEPAA